MNHLEKWANYGTENILSLASSYPTSYATTQRLLSIYSSSVRKCRFTGVGRVWHQTKRRQSNEHTTEVVLKQPHTKLDKSPMIKVFSLSTFVSSKYNQICTLPGGPWVPKGNKCRCKQQIKYSNIAVFYNFTLPGWAIQVYFTTPFRDNNLTGNLLSHTPAGLLWGLLCIMLKWDCANTL